MNIPRLALRLAYWGPGFQGFARQPGQRTVERELLNALLQSADIVASVDKLPRTLGYRSGSRTDRDVSALANAVSLNWPLGETGRRPEAVLGKASEILIDREQPLWITGWSLALDEFNPRHARSRTYRYLLLNEGIDANKVAGTGRLLEGVHDFGSFCRPDGQDTRLELSRVEVTETGSWLALRFTAPRFRWRMVRQLTWALAAVGQGRLTRTAVAEALARPDPDRGWGAAPARGLTLEDIDYPGLEWRTGPGSTPARNWSRNSLPEARWKVDFIERLWRTADEGAKKFK